MESGRMGRRRGSCEAKEVDEARETEKRSVDRDSDEQADEAEAVKGFFACYLLCSLSPRHKAHTYIGFTVNPRRRIKQHNGEMRCGAWRTKRGRPWEMVLCIYGFPSNVSALQFEWAWQHPTESLAVRKAASSFKSLRGLTNKIKLAYTMLTLPSWENLNLTVNLFSTKHTKHIAGCPRLPNQMRFNICAMDDLPCYAEGRALLCGHDDFDEDDGEEEIIEDVNLPASVDVTIKGLNRNVDQMGSSSSLSPNSCTDDVGMEQVRQKSSPRGSDSERMTDDLLLSPEAGVINLCTPSSGIIRSKTKRALFDSAIIDLTDSPMVIQV